MDIQKLVDAMSDAARIERSKYHVTLGDLIDKLKSADDDLKITPHIVGLGAYRGYYSDIALCTESGSKAYESEYDYFASDSTDKWSELQKTAVTIDFTGTPKEIATKLESLIGRYFDGYKGGFNEITRDKPLWIATDYGDCSDVAVVAIKDNLELVTSTIE